MTLKSDAKFKEKLTCSFKYDMWNLVKFQPTTQISEKIFFRTFFSKVYKNTEELSFMILNSDAKFE